MRRVRPIALRLTAFFAAGLFVLCGCARRAEPEDSRSEPAATTGSTAATSVAAASAATTALAGQTHSAGQTVTSGSNKGAAQYDGLQVSDGVNVHWYTLNWLQDSSAEADTPRAFSPHYSSSFTPQPDYGVLLPYVGLYAGWFPIYGLLDEQLRIVTPAVYDSFGGNNYITFLMGNTWKAEDDPRIDRIYTYDPQFKLLYQKFTVIPYDGSWMLDDNYCFYERIDGGYALFSLDGSLTLIDEKGKITQKLSGGDYCWVQPIETGRLFAFHGLDGTVTVRDRTGKTVSRFTKEQMGDDVRFTYPGSMPPETELVWSGNIGYVQHYEDSSGNFWITRYLYADTGEVKRPPVKGLTRYDRITPDRAEDTPAASEAVPEVIRAYPYYSSAKDIFTGKTYYFTRDPATSATQKGEVDWSEYSAEGWDLRDSSGRCLRAKVNRHNTQVMNNYICTITVDDDAKTVVTRYSRAEDDSTVFHYRAYSDEADY